MTTAPILRLPRPALRLIAALAATSVLLGACNDGIFPIQAATPPGPEKTLPSGFELIVFETTTCQTCLLFRRDVAPRYQTSIRGSTAPLRYIDLTGKSAGPDGRHDAALREPLRMLPTVILAEDGREFARIEGYTGPDNFFQMVAYAFKHRSGAPEQAARTLPITRH